MSQSGSAVLFALCCFVRRPGPFSDCRLRKDLKMKRTYLVKKDPQMPMGEENWIIMNAIEFREFMKTEDGRSRRQNFGQMDGFGREDTIIIAECGKETARKWRAEKDCRDYAEERKKKSTCFCNPLMYLSDLSRNRVQSMFFPDECYDMEEIVWDRLEHERLCMAVENLAPFEKKLIRALFNKEKPKSEEEIGRIFGISRQTLRSYKKLTLDKIKDYLENSLF